jgi:predicted TIM-barrel fold metal-dependent hydrolase
LDAHALGVLRAASGAVGGNGPGAFLLAQRALRDVDFRLQVIDDYGDYRQILTPVPYQHLDPRLAGRPLLELVRRNNDELAEIVRLRPDRFAGFAAATAIADPDAAAEEAVRSVCELGALGVQLEADAVNLPLHEDSYDPLFAAMEELGAGVWLHPVRTPATPGAPRDSAAFLLWQVFGWPFDTTITVSRLIFAGIYDRRPRLKLIVHHGGGLIPHFSGRAALMPSFTAMDAGLAQALARLQKAPIEYFRMLYVDTALSCSGPTRRSIREAAPNSSRRRSPTSSGRSSRRRRKPRSSRAMPGGCSAAVESDFRSHHGGSPW